MSWGHWHDDHGHGGSTSWSNALGECLFWYTKETASAATWITNMFYSTFLGIFWWGGGGWGWHDHGHH